MNTVQILLGHLKSSTLPMRVVGLLTVLLVSTACTKDEAPQEAVQPSDAGAIDPNAPALPSGDMPVDPASAGDLPPDPAIADPVTGSTPEAPAADTGVNDPVDNDNDEGDAPLGTLTDDPWAKPGTPADIKSGSGKVAGEDLAGSGKADTSDIPSMADPQLGSTSDSGFAPAKKSKTPKVAPTPAKKSKVTKKTAKKSSTAKSAQKAGKKKSAAALAAGTTGGDASQKFVRAIQLNVRAAPDKSAAVVRRLNGGDAVTVTIEGAWARLAEGEYVRAKFLSSKPQKVVSEDEIKAAWAAKKNHKAKKAKTSKKEKAVKKKAATKKSASASKKAKSKSGQAPGQTNAAGAVDPTGSTDLPPPPDAQNNGAGAPTDDESTGADGFHGDQPNGETEETPPASN